MTRQLLRVDARDPDAVSAALRDALTADRPAIFPAAPEIHHAGLPGEVPQRIALVVETSGSSGRPKRVALTADALLASAAASATALGGQGQWMLALPTHYIAGVNVLVRSIAAEVEPVLLPPGSFDAAGFVEAVERMAGDRRFTSLVPAQLARVVALGEQDPPAIAILRSLDRILVGGQSTPPELLERAAALGLAVTRTYGASETAGGCVYDGAPIGTASVRVVEGEVQLAGPMLAEGYLDDPERTAAAFVVADGTRWYRTGDTGSVADGVLAVTGRLDRVIISGGEKVSLDAVERVARGVPGVTDAVAVPVDDVRWGQSYVLVVVAHNERAGPDAERLTEVLRAALGRAAGPSRVIRVPRISLLASGKPDRIRLAAEFGAPASPSSHPRPSK